MVASRCENRFYLLVGNSLAIIFKSRTSSTRRRYDAANTGRCFWTFIYFLKPSDDVRQVCGIIRDNVKHFLGTPDYNSICFDFGSFAHFPTGGAVSCRPIPDLGAATIDPTFVYAKHATKRAYTSIKLCLEI